jgi:YesN/AraC family two-component response regulator
MQNKQILEPINIAQTAFISTSLLSKNEIEYYLEKLDELVNGDEIYTDPSLSLRDLAEKLELHPNKLSWLLNEHIGRNFNEYINAFRLITFKEKALNPNNKHFTLLGLAYESGFSSKTVFNTFFKKSEGMSPSVWVKSYKE